MKQSGTGCPVTSKYGMTPPNKHGGVGRQQQQHGWMGGWLVGSLVRWFVGSLVRWLVGSLVRWFVGSLVRWFVGSLVRWLDCLFLSLIV